MRLRIVLGTVGVLLGLFGVFRLLTQVPLGDVVFLLVWLVGALIVHDGILSPLVLAVGGLVARTVPPRARRFVQGGLVSGALITLIALPMIYRAHSQPTVKAILEQNFAANLGVLLAIVAGGAVLLYLLRVVRDHQAVSATNSRSPADHDSSSP
jgi:hypothetical protein